LVRQVAVLAQQAMAATLPVAPSCTEVSDLPVGKVAAYCLTAAALVARLDTATTEETVPRMVRARTLVLAEAEAVAVVRARLVL
jgi:hypothetical protein